MKRPIKYKYANKVALLEYNQLLEAYCDELEQRCLSDEWNLSCLDKDCKKLEKALEKICKEIVNLKEAADCYEYEQCPFRKECSNNCNAYCYHVKAWADWAMEEE